MTPIIRSVLGTVLVASSLALASPASACFSEADLAARQVRQFLKKLHLDESAKVQIALGEKKERGVAQVQLQKRYGVLSLELRKLDGRWRVVSN